MVRVPDEQEQRRYFDAQMQDSLRWASRMDLAPEEIFTPGAAALDFGCGHGALCVHAAMTGAEVIGLDTSEQRISFATRHITATFPAVADRIRFICGDIANLPGVARFDVIVSKDTFEHVADVDAALDAFRRLLKPGGRICLGFSPLWHSPFGDHGFLTKRRMPWMHLFLSDDRFLTAHNAHTGRQDKTVEQAGFNRLEPADYRAAFALQGFLVETSHINRAGPFKRVLFLPLTLGRRISALERYSTIGMYVTLRLGHADANKLPAPVLTHRLHRAAA